ncbi:MAG: hypothetical protein H8E20_07155 [Verrucomicrobia bacterium]|nr:hypothetical protein [Verrucomicrobiota bacterium]
MSYVVLAVPRSDAAIQALIHPQSSVTNVFKVCLSDVSIDSIHYFTSPKMFGSVEVEALNRTIYVIGDFDMINGVNTTNIARWVEFNDPAQGFFAGEWKPLAEWDLSYNGAEYAVDNLYVNSATGNVTVEGVYLYAILEMGRFIPVPGRATLHQLYEWPGYQWWVDY